jgi:hypothetical protein
MRLLLAFLALAVALPLAAAADPSTTPGYTAKDQAQFAKLAAGNGTWTCIDTPASKKPDVQTTKQDGNWYVTHESGDDPSIGYARWSHTLQEYVANIVNDSGSMIVSTTKSDDPFNATWQVAYPANQGAYPFTIALAGNVMTSQGQYKDDKGKVVSFKSVCTKS